MNLINRLTIFLLIICSSKCATPSAINSFHILNNSANVVHATPHITNIIRNGFTELSDYQIQELPSLGLGVQSNKIISIIPNDLDQYLDTDHFRLHYTLEGTDAVANIDYVITMSEVYEQVYKFFIDTLGFTPPPNDPNKNYNLYDIYIENLPTYYFGITYTANSDIDAPSCASYIRMRNNYSGSQFGEHTELENIKVTSVHEFFHSIQFGYNCYERLWFMEATAVWSEDELFDGINDLYRYLPSWFSNPNKPIDDESNHMYGTFIFFQYIDEHLGGAETIRSCWENSNILANPVQDISFQAIDEALSSFNSSFEDALTRMRIANKILNANAGIYSYTESDGYKSVINPVPEELLFFQSGTIENTTNYSLERYESNYYKLETTSPVEINFFQQQGHSVLSSIVKHEDIDKWTVRSANTINIDTGIDIEWISLVVSAIDGEQSQWEYTIQISDGYSEDFTLYNPYPNPSMGKNISLDLQSIEQQEIQTSIINILGETVWRSSHLFQEPDHITFIWNGKNQYGKNVSNGIYFVKAKGKTREIIHKITLMKK